MHRGMAAQLRAVGSGAGMQLWSTAAPTALLLPGTGELCEQGPRHRAERSGAASLFVAKGPKFAFLLLAQRSVFKENQHLWPVHEAFPQRVPLEYRGEPLTTLEPGGFSPPGSTGGAGRLGWDD